MRVIAGAARGLRLSAPPGIRTRPTADRMKENLFNILRPYNEGARFLDLFSGSGAIGIEALSRGAREAVFVERSISAARAIQGNLRRTNLSGSAYVLVSEAVQAIKALAKKNEPFDIIFMDPPYQSGMLGDALAALGESGLLAADGIIAAEMPAAAAAPVSRAFDIYMERSYGSTRFVFYRKTQREAGTAVVYITETGDI